MKPDKHKKKASNAYRNQHDLKTNNQKKKETEEQQKVKDEESKPGTSKMVEDADSSSQAEVEIKYRKREVVVQKDRVFELPEEEPVQRIGRSVYDIINTPGSYKHLLLNPNKVEKVEKSEQPHNLNYKDVKLSMIRTKMAAELKHLDLATSKSHSKEDNDELKVTYNEGNRLTASGFNKRGIFDENIASYGDTIKDVYLNNLRTTGDPLDFRTFGTASEKDWKYLKKKERKVVGLNSYEYPIDLQQGDTSTDATEALLKKYEEDKLPDKSIDPTLQALLKIRKSKTSKKDQKQRHIGKFMEQFRQMMIPVSDLNGDEEKMMRERYLSGPPPLISEFIPIALNKFNGSEESLNGNNSEDDFQSDLHSKLHSEPFYEPQFEPYSKPDIDEKKNIDPFCDMYEDEVNETEDVKVIEELHPGTDDMSMEDILNLIR